MLASTLLKKSIEREERSNFIHSLIKKFSELFPDEFDKCDIKKCGHCNGIGFSDKSLTSLCFNCGGVGYVGFKKLYGKYICRSCNSYGCEKCDYKGTVDWITHANGKDITYRR